MATSWPLRWSAWIPLAHCWRAGLQIPHNPGLYRIRLVGSLELDYLDQTGGGSMTLRKRIALLKGVYDAQMPYRDPHSAGPSLWALRHATGKDFEVSVATVEGSTQWRKGLECRAIAEYRQEHRRSPTCNFGRMPKGYRMSSPNNERLAAEGKRYRGGPTSSDEDSHVPGLAPLGPLTDPPIAAGWYGLPWSQWTRADQASIPAGNGVYRMRQAAARELAFLGEGSVSTRIADHLAKLGVADKPQSVALAAAQPLEASWVIHDNWPHHQRLEILNDLVASHLLVLGAPPAAQFLG